jgi:hypothetical protein
MNWLKQRLIWPNLSIKLKIFYYSFCSADSKKEQQKNSIGYMVLGHLGMTARSMVMRQNGGSNPTEDGCKFSASLWKLYYPSAATPSPFGKNANPEGLQTQKGRSQGLPPFSPADFFLYRSPLPPP